MRISLHPPASKSESNRALIIEALAFFQQGQKDYESLIQNLSTARDTQTLQALLHHSSPIADVLDAGTTMRFLTAYFAVTQQAKQLSGTARMHQRPIGILVDALCEIGFELRYLAQNGFPPIETIPIATEKLRHLSSEITLQAAVSSQYISALLMIAPLLPNGLVLNLVGKISSLSYIQMTLKQMQHYGVEATWQGTQIKVMPQKYQIKPFAVETDWSGASYWYSFLALCGWKKGQKAMQLHLKGLRPSSLQGDSVIAQLMQPLGIQTVFDAEGACLHFTGNEPLPTHLSIDFSNCPDLAQTFLVCAALLQINLTITGLESLRIKETDRIFALQQELAKINVQLLEKNTHWELHSRNLFLPNELGIINTYQDHRMAMAFAALTMFCQISIEEPQVVHKSYPHFWGDMDIFLNKIT